MFDPKTNKYPYPLDTDKHYLEVKKNRGIVFDADYPYIDKSRRFRFVDFVYRVLLRIIVFPIVRVRLGLRTEGKENLKKYRDVIDSGIVSVCNHVHMWDYLAILSVVKPHRVHLLSWAPNINGENGTMIRHVGGIPIPEDDVGATRAYLRAIHDLLKSGGWLHVYAEGSMWEYYAPIRPFKQGVSYFSCANDVPVLPLAYSYRKPGWIRRKIFRQIACFTLNVGEPVYADKELPKKQRQTDLTVRCHEAVCALAGFKPGENVYPPLFEDSKRIDYYTDTYGVGYKGSW